MIRVGKIVATHGLQGALIMTHIVGTPKWLKKEGVLFVELHRESYIPFFVASVKVVNDEEFVITLEDVNTVEAAKKLVTKQVHVEEAVIAEFAKESPLSWIGFKLVDESQGDLGPIEDVMQTSAQWLARITYKGVEALIPLVDQTIQKIDINTKTLYVDLPEGLLEVYL